MSAQTVRNSLREAHLRARRPQQGLDLTAGQHPNRLQMATGTLEKCALHGWIPVSTALGRRRRVGEHFADVKVVNRVPHRGSGIMLWAGKSYRQRTQLHFIDGNLKAEIL